ncbi:MAG: peptidase [Gammaproteobacteria bacterium]|nr:peptidase [Gammaproteobacteria bacterium]
MEFYLSKTNLPIDYVKFSFLIFLKKVLFSKLSYYYGQAGWIVKIIYRKLLQKILTLLITVLLVSCGDGGGSTGGWTSGVFQPASDFEARCASPRSGTDDIQGTIVDENNWLRSWSNDTYLWYDEIVDRNPASYATLEYFDLLKTDAITPSGNPKDKFHFTYDTDEWIALSQSGVSAGYGAQWVIIAGAPPRQVLVAYTEPGSPATSVPANLVRGAEILAVDGVDVIYGNDVNTLNAAFFPEQAGENHSFTVRDPGGEQRSFTMQSANVTSDPVQSVQTLAGGEVGYILFNDHIATAEEELVDAIDWLDTQNVTDFVLDIRYNGGGYLAIASQLAYMIAGDARTSGNVFESTTFNDKHPTTDIFGNPLTPMPFIDETIGFGSLPAGQALPSLGLSRVFVLTGPNTCSASESIINSLQGIGVEVIQIGSTTCGKPYGFYPQDNCGTTYFTIQFKGENALGFGDYTDGFSPANTTSDVGTTVTGCSVADDFTHQLGDIAESRLAAALSYRAGNPCGAATGNSRRVISRNDINAPISATDGYTPKSPWLQNRIINR